jgi:phosphoribosylaminoimidazole carboxylase
LQINAELLEARISGASNQVIREKLERYASYIRDEIVVMAGRLEEVGFKAH